MIPIDVTRPLTRQAIEAAAATERKLIAIFAQRTSDTDRPGLDAGRGAGQAERPAAGLSGAATGREDDLSQPGAGRGSTS
ncbi:MAG TPA: hypothetical protein VHW23_32835 [Kofleriaceae bacterium]|nr:hypothetical protein [Kofleriaceae bacterium]